MIPEELKEFFKESGRILLIKGNAGTGKTLLGFKLLKEMNEQGDVVWVNSRDMDSADIAELEEIIPNKKRLDATQTKERVNETSATEKVQVVPHLPTDFEVIEALYEEVSQIENPTVVVDSFEGLTTDLDEQQKENLRIRLVRLARDTNANIAVVMETFAPNPLDYLADGMITLIDDTLDDRRIRKIQLNKLRGTLIKRPYYLFTLSDGNFKYFSPFNIDIVAKPITPTPIPDFDDKISTGINDFDILLSGGYLMGGTHLFEIDTSIGKYYENIFIPTIINQINQNRGIIFVPPDGRNIATLIKSINPYVNKNKINELITSLGKSSDKTPYSLEIFQAEGKSLGEDIAPLLLERDNYHKNGPVLIFIGTDTLEYTYGVESAHVTITDIVSDTKVGNDIILLLATKDQKLSDRISHIVDTHWRLQDIHDSIIIYGIIPRTELFCVSIDVTKGFIEPKFTPIL
jgi:KaiC/GvpD/RAD55 family RecA-like ATPase